MDMKFAAMAAAGICILVLLIGILKQKSEFILNFLVRMSVGLHLCLLRKYLSCYPGIRGMVCEPAQCFDTGKPWFWRLSVALWHSFP